MCRQNLGENDYEKLDQVENCDNLLASLPVLQEMMGYPTGPSLVQRLRPSFDSLRSFVTLLAAAMGSTTIQTALIWGIMSLVIQVSSLMSSDIILPLAQWPFVEEC